MSAVVVEIAEAVTTAINAATLSQTFVAERAYVPVHELPDLVDLAVTVVPTSIGVTPLTRHSDDHEYTVDVGVQKRCTPDTTDADPLMLLVEEIIDLFRGKTLTGYTAAKCLRVANDPIYVPAHLDDERVFTSVVTLTFRVARDQT